MLARLTTNVRARWVLAAILLAALAAVRAGAPDERDPYWSARAGIETLAGMPLARPDTWSWSQPGGIWYQNSPAWNVVLGLVWQAAGFWGLFWVGFASIGALFAMGALLARKLGARPLPGLAGFLAVIVLALPMLSLRATVVVQTLLLVAAWAGHVLLPRLARTRAAVAVPALAAGTFLASAAGNWLHLSFIVMAPAISVMWAVQLTTLPFTWRRRALLWLPSAAGLAAGVLTTPYGLVATLEQSAKTQAECAGLIGEWTSAWIMGPIWWVRAAGCLALAGAATWWLVRQWRNRRWHSSTVRLVAPLTVVAAPTALAGLSSIRFLGISLLVMLPVAAWMATRLADRTKRRAAAATRGPLRVLHSRGYTQGTVWTVILALAVVILAPFAVAKSAAGARPDEQSVIDLLPYGCKLFSPADVAGPVILTRPDVAVWQDGRADYYGRNQIVESYRIMAGVAPVPAGATCVIIGDSTVDSMYPLAVEAMDADPAWRRAAEVDHFILWLPVEPD